MTKNKSSIFRCFLSYAWYWDFTKQLGVNGLSKEKKIPLMILLWWNNLQIVYNLVLSSSRRTMQSNAENAKLILLSLFSSILSCLSPLSLLQREREAQAKIAYNYAKIFFLFYCIVFQNNWRMRNPCPGSSCIMLEGLTHTCVNYLVLKDVDDGGSSFRKNTFIFMLDTPEKLNSEKLNCMCFFR